ncbi:hypothetical protein F6Y05_35415 [Bacillus megaterium]|nr:hypothetical protein [Priestia megaterium]
MNLLIRKRKGNPILGDFHKEKMGLFAILDKSEIYVSKTNRSSNKVDFYRVVIVTRYNKYDYSKFDLEMYFNKGNSKYWYLTGPSSNDFHWFLMRHLNIGYSELPDAEHLRWDEYLSEYLNKKHNGFALQKMFSPLD